MNKQKAVEFLIKAFQDTYGDTVVDLVSAQIKQAKAMGKQQILDFARTAIVKAMNEDIQNPFNLEQYYNETYGKRIYTLRTSTCS